MFCHIFYQLYKIDSLMFENKFIAGHLYKGLCSEYKQKCCIFIAALNSKVPP